MIAVANLTRAAVLLAVEIADSSLAFDLGAKAQIYAHFGVPELWVIDAERNRTHVHRSPEDDRYNFVAAFSADELVTPPVAPGEFALRLADLDLAGL